MNLDLAEEYAFFDVDGTVIRNDSFLLLLKTALSSNPIRTLFIVIFSPIFLLTHMFKIDKKYAKSCVLWSLTVGKSKRDSVKYLSTCLEPFFKDLWFSNATQELEKLRQDGLKICFVSASGQIWLRALLNSQDKGFKTIIGSKLGFFAGGVILKGNNCYNKEKLTRIINFLNKSIIWKKGYSDHPADIPMLEKCQERFVVSPKEKHLKQFREELNHDFKKLEWK